MLNQHAKRKYIAVLAVGTLFATTFHAFPLDITTVKGKTYTGVTVQRVEPDGINIKHSAGIIKLYFSELPTEVQEQYGYSREKHQQYYIAKQKQAEVARSAALIDSAALYVVARISQVTDDGALAYIQVVRVVTEEVTSTHTGQQVAFGKQSMPSGSSGSVVKEEKHVIYGEESKEPVLITDIPGYKVDGDTWSGYIYIIGEYDYTAVSSAHKRVRKFTASRTKAVNYLME